MRTKHKCSRKAAVSAPVAKFRELESLLLKLAAQRKDLKRAADGSLPDALAGWLVPEYLLTVQEELAAVPEGPKRFKLLRRAASDIVALQRGGYWGGRLLLDHERLELARQKHRDALAALSALQPGTRKRRDPKLPLSDEDRQAIVDKVDAILGLK